MILHNRDIISSVSIYQIQCCKKSEYLHFTDWAHKEERGEECVFYSIDTNVRRQKKFFSVTESKKFSHHFLNKSGSCNWQSFVIILPWDRVVKVATTSGTHWDLIFKEILEISLNFLKGCLHPFHHMKMAQIWYSADSLILSLLILKYPASFILMWSA